MRFFLLPLLVLRIQLPGFRCGASSQIGPAMNCKREPKPNNYIRLIWLLLAFSLIDGHRKRTINARRRIIQRYGCANLLTFVGVVFAVWARTITTGEKKR